MGEAAPARASRARGLARAPGLRLGLLGGVAFVVLIQLVSVAGAQPAGSAAGVTVAATSTPAPTLVLGIGDEPGSICASNTTTCSVGTAESRVQMSVTAEAPLTTWPAVEIAFVVETDAFDGVYDPVLQKL